MIKSSSLNGFLNNTKVRGTQGQIRLVVIASTLLLPILVLTGCAAPTAADIKSSVANRGMGIYVNGRESFEEEGGAACLITKDIGIIVTEVDGKPFFWEQKSFGGINSLYGPYKKHASPLGLPPGCVLVVHPGARSLTLKYEQRNAIDVQYSKGEMVVNFVAEKDHAYLINRNLTRDKKTGVSWHPTITGVDAQSETAAH
jgi:hypothetical protein